MALTGLPDFGAPVPGDQRGLHAPYGSGAFVLEPTGLAVATLADGTPALSLVLVRPVMPSLPPVPYGVLDLKLAATYAFDEALVALRSQLPTALLAPVTIARGRLRMAAKHPGEDAARLLAEPVELRFDGLNRARCTLNLPIETAVLFQSLLSTGVTAVDAYAELDYAGVAPRLPASVRFDPAQLLAALPGATVPPATGRLVARDDLLDVLTTDRSALPLAVDARGDLDPAALAACLVDWIRTRYAEPAPAPSADFRSYLRLPDVGPAGDVTWDLAEPLVTTRPLVLAMDPLATTRPYVEAHGTSALVSRRVVPPLETGQLTVTATANLPPTRLGVLGLGLEVVAPPNPPLRPQRVGATAEFRSPDDAATLHLRLSPAEAPRFQVTAYAVTTESGDEPLRGPAATYEGRVVNLGVDDFPVRFLPVRADDDLLRMARVHVRYEPPEAEGDPLEFDLDAQQAAVAIVVPAEPTGLLHVEVEALDGTGRERLGPLPPRPLTVTPTLLPGYGPQRVQIAATFAGPDGLVAVDLLPEGRPDTPDQVTTLALTARDPTRTWSYLPGSPFVAGYRWRLFRSAGPPAAWSDVQPRGTPLVVAAG